MGDVYRARDTRLDRDVAVKVLPLGLASDPDVLERFEREARAVAALSHPNILALHDFGSSNGTAYAVTELLRGETARQRLRQGVQPLGEMLDSMLQVADGLAAAHDRGIIHRDLKPENVFFQDDGRVKLLDFGLARFLPTQGDPPAGTQPRRASGPGRSRSGSLAQGDEPTIALRVGSSRLVIGSVGYMSPEQARGQDVDARSDIFSLGALLYEMATGTRAFRSGREGGPLLSVVEDAPPPPSTHRPGVPADLDRIIMHCLEKEPRERFQSVRDLAFDLTAVREHQDLDRRAGRSRAAAVGTATLSSSLGVALPEAACRALGLAAGERLDVYVHADRLELRPRKRRT
jgi:serine/threonine protein kinase